MARWQRRARLGFGLFAAAFAILLWFTIGERRQAAPPPPVQRLEPKAVSEIKGGDVVQVKGAKRDIRIEFATQVLYEDGSARYTGFKAFIDDRGGRAFEITGTDARVAPEQSALDVSGNVNVRTSDGLVARTERAAFTEADGILRGDGPISFERGRTKGSGVGFRYEQSIDRLELLNQAVVDVAADGDAGAMSVRSGSAAYSRAERFFRFERGMRMERDGQVIQADAATVFLLPDRDEPKVVELRGNAAIQGAASSTLRQMQARDMNLTYATDGRTLEHALLVGEGRIDMARNPDAAGQELRGDTLDVLLAPTGAVTQLLGRNNIQVTMPPLEGVAARQITSETMSGSGKHDAGIDDMVFETNVEYREDVPGGNPRVVQARTLHARLSKEGQLETANFTGGFVFRQGTLQAAAPEAAYQVQKGTLNLFGGAPAKPPSMRNERVDLRQAETINVALAPLHVAASGNVQAVFAAGRQEGERGTSVFNDQEAIAVVCDKLTFDEVSGEGLYTGTPAQVFQDSGNRIRAEVIAMNEKTGLLTAKGGVVTTLPIAATDAPGAKGNSTGRAGQFEFDDSKRRALYTDGAQLDGQQGNLRADRIELALQEKGNEMRQLGAEGNVTVFVEDRKATGDTLVYHPSDERYVLNGAPVRLVRGCQESAGRTLTFYRGSERVLVDGNESRVQTKGGKCPESPR
jgi:lipopolysaccharide export system protein LptA